MAENDRNKGVEQERRRLLQAGAGAVALGVIPGAGQLAALAQGAFDWKKFKGEKIEVFLVKSPRGDLLTKYHKEFEDLTGITVGSEMIPEQQQRQKAVIEFNSGNTSFDVIAISYHVQKRLFGKNKWLDDVRPMMADKSLVDPNLDFADFAKGGLTYATQADGRIDSLPLNLRSVGRLLQQGAVRRQRRRLSEELRRDGRRRGAPQRPGQGGLRIRRARAQECQRAGLVELPLGLWRRVHRCQRQADDRHARGARSGEDVPDAAREVRSARRGRDSTGTNRRASSSKARQRCGSTASVSRSPSRIRRSRGSSARSATA
jgi:hypothetical protein